MSSEQRDDTTPKPAEDALSLGKAYDPRKTEPRWYRFWEENGFFNGERGSRGHTGDVHGALRSSRVSQ